MCNNTLYGVVTHPTGDYCNDWIASEVILGCDTVPETEVCPGVFEAATSGDFPGVPDVMSFAGFLIGQSIAPLYDLALTTGSIRYAATAGHW